MHTNTNNFKYHKQREIMNHIKFFIFYSFIWSSFLFKCLSTQDLSSELENIPNPWNISKNCHNSGFLPSFVCDVNNTLNVQLIRKIDELLFRFSVSSKCVCTECSQNRNAITVVIIVVNIKSLVPFNGGRLGADKLRKKWRLGDCDNDMLFILNKATYTTSLSLGEVTKKILGVHTPDYYEELMNPKNYKNDEIIKKLEVVLRKIEEKVIQTAETYESRDDIDYMDYIHSYLQPSLSSSTSLPLSSSSSSSSSISSLSSSTLSSTSSKLPLSSVISKSNEEIINFSMATTMSIVSTMLPLFYKNINKTITSNTSKILESSTSSMSLSSSTDVTIDKMFPSAHTTDDDDDDDDDDGDNDDDDLKPPLLVVPAKKEKEISNFNDNIREKASLKIETILIIAIIVICLISLITLSLMIWYCRKKSGKIETNVKYNAEKEKQANIKPNNSVKVTKYEPVATEEKNV